MSSPARIPQRAPQLTVAQALAPPHNIDAEESVLGAILLSDRPMYSLAIEEGLRAEDFYRDRHGVIYTAMVDLYERSEPVDALTVIDALRSSGMLDAAGGAETVELLAGPVPNVANLRHYAQIVRETALLRRLLGATYEIQSSVLDQHEPAREIVERAERTMLEVAHAERRHDFREISALLHDELDKLHELSVSGEALTGTPTGFKELDRMTGGFQPGNLIVIAARPSMGKSCLVTNIAENAAISHEQARSRCSASRCPRRSSRGASSPRRRASAARTSARAASPRRRGRRSSRRALAWRTRRCGSMTRATSACSRSARRRAGCTRSPGGLGLVIVDYLQLLRAESRSENRAEIIGQMSRGLKMLARELDVPVVALSQLNRSVESRNPKIPMLSDLRESGAVEQDADVVIFIYRDDYYHPENSDTPSTRPGEADLIIAKNRNGPVGTVVLTFRPEYPRFMNYSSAEQYA